MVCGEKEQRKTGRNVDKGKGNRKLGTHSKRCAKEAQKEELVALTGAREYMGVKRRKADEEK